MRDCTQSIIVQRKQRRSSFKGQDNVRAKSVRSCKEQESRTARRNGKSSIPDDGGLTDLVLLPVGIGRSESQKQEAGSIISTEIADDAIVDVESAPDILEAVGNAIGDAAGAIAEGAGAVVEGIGDIIGGL